MSLEIYQERNRGAEQDSKAFRKHYKKDTTPIF